MSAESARHLKPAEDEPALIVVNPATGEQVGSLDDHTQRLKDEVASLTRNLCAEGVRYENLKRDKAAEAEKSPVWPAALRIFDHWRCECKHPRSEFSLDRFEMIRPFLEKLSAPKRGRPDSAEARLKKAEEICKLAVDGIAHDPFVTTRKNGSRRFHNGWHLIFGEADQFEERCNAAPIERIREVMGPPKAEQTTLDQAQDQQ